MAATQRRRRCTLAIAVAVAPTDDDDEDALDDARPLRQVLPPLRTPRGRGAMHVGAMWSGSQRSGRTSYGVSVTVTHMDMERGTGGGTLLIRGLTPDLPVLQTYFDIEIIGSQYGFLTGKWGATESDDMLHWSRFPLFRTLVKPTLQPPNHRMLWRNDQRPVVFMRWKERFVVPDHRQSDQVTGASFDGFYYVCCDLSPPLLPSSSSSSPPHLARQSAPLPRTRSTSHPLSPTASTTHSPRPPPSPRPSLLPAFSYAAIARRHSQPSTLTSTPHVDDVDALDDSNLFFSETDFPPPTSPRTRMPTGPLPREDESLGFVEEDGKRQSTSLQQQEGGTASSFPRYFRSNSFSNYSPITTTTNTEVGESTMGWWQDAKIVAFYYHKALSTPYQELLLKYQRKDRGGSATYEFA